MGHNAFVNEKINSSTKRKRLTPVIMDFKLVLVAFACISAASAQFPINAYYTGMIPTAPVAAAAPDCFEGKIAACRAHFKGQTSTWNCAGHCGLCDLCGLPNSGDIAECSGICTLGVAKCTRVCENGRVQCMACGVF